MHFMPPPNYELHERRKQNQDRLTPENTGTRAVRFLGKLTGRLFRRAPATPEHRGFEVVATPLHYTSSEAGVSEAAGTGLSTEQKLEIMRDTPQPEDAGQN
ncbi:MAG TPA: hypothetical protein VFW77_01050 [Candidatus Saccharimonadales bacterium]|nr:hypothetical protein [Candidatus Saccharimonadales bacterium]